MKFGTKGKIGILFIAFQCILLIVTNFIENSSTQFIENPKWGMIVASLFVSGLGPFMSIYEINLSNFHWTIENIIVVIVSYIPVILLIYGFFIAQGKQFIIPLLIGFIMWPLVGWFWAAMSV